MFKLVGAVFTVAGVGMLAGGFWLYSSTRQFLEEAKPAQGAVIEMVRKSSTNRRGGATFAPVVRFRTANGRDVEFESSTSSNPPSYTVGDAVPVLYDPRRPERASINSFFSLWFGALFLLTLGVGFTAGGILMLLSSLKERARRAAWAREREGREALRQTGRRIESTFQEVRTGAPGSYTIVSQWYDAAAGAVYVFESDAIGFNPFDFVADRPVVVYIDPRDPRRYLVDTSSLPTLAMSNPG